jgi:alpha-glucosidase
LPFNFSLLSAPRNAPSLAKLIADYEQGLPAGGWPNWVLGNHDKIRIASRVGSAQARIAAFLLLTLRGTPTLYYGDELGMEDVPVPPELARDTWTRSEPGIGVGRDAQRTPMQWDASLHAGFTSGEPWLPVGPSHTSVNVKLQREDPGSMLALYRQLIELRRGSTVLLKGAKKLVAAPDSVLAYERVGGHERLLIALNFCPQPREMTLARGKIMLSTHLDRGGEQLHGALRLRGDEGVIVNISP